MAELLRQTVEIDGRYLVHLILLRIIKAATDRHYSPRQRWVSKIVLEITAILHIIKFWVEAEKRFVKLRVSAKGMRIIDKKGIDSVLEEMRGRGEKV